MRINNAAIYPYQLPLIRPWSTARGVIRERRGWLVALQDESGETGWGDCAPLPEAGTEEPTVSLPALREFIGQCPGREPPELLSLLDGAPPAARCALESALLDLQARAANKPLSALFGGRQRERVQVNAACGALGDQDRGCIDSASAAGYHIVKLKVGLADPADETARLHRLTRQLSGAIRFRLDANGAWSPEQARRFIGGLDGVPIEALEEPLRDADLHSLQELQAQCSFPLALDESLARLQPEDLHEGPVRRLVLKPTVLGGPLVTLRWAEQAQALDMETVVTSTLESAIGLALCMQLAAALPDDAVHGLGTANWFADDLAELPPPTDGWLSLPAGPGIGVTPAVDRLTR